MDSIEKLLKELTEAPGVPGYEEGARQVVKHYCKPLGKISTDRLGSVICEKKGKTAAPRIMLAGHMDEIGFMVRLITKEGFIKFTALGGWWDHILLTQRVVIKTRKGDVLGVIGAKPPHLLRGDQRNKMVEKKKMYIDTGLASKKAVEKVGVRVGDPIVPVSAFTPMADPKIYMAKAFDDRAGCAMVIAAMQKLKSRAHPNTIIGAHTVQEEVGLRGASTAVELCNPDVGIVLETDIAGDTPGISDEESPTTMGGGPSILLYDARMIPNLKLRDLVIDTAKKGKIPLQFNSMDGGATDGAAIHLHKSGVPTIVIGVPTRHIHSHNGMLSRKDFDNAVKLLVALVIRLDKKTVDGLTPW
ncbi:M42 family metallopeptidase [Planctomycetota bacterium]